MAATSETQPRVVVTVEATKDHLHLKLMHCLAEDIAAETKSDPPKLLQVVVTAAVINEMPPLAEVTVVATSYRLCLLHKVSNLARSP